ncbi:hypothetical protein [Caproicibacterium sp. XB1]|uniref:hypothetical protein n=1 Tax=Caproicibacterium sp. XB1 TaxID=3396405 RepID=UPI0039B6F7C6
MRYTCIKKKYPQFSKDCKECPEYNPCVKDCKYCFVGAMENERMIPDAAAPLAQDAAAPVMVKHDYRDVKIAENTTVTIDLEEVKENMRKQIYAGAFDVLRSAT